MAFDWLIYILTGSVSKNIIFCHFRCRSFVTCVFQSPLWFLKIRFISFILLINLILNKNYNIFPKNGSFTARVRDFLGCKSERAGVLGFPRPCRFWQFVVSAPWRRPIFFSRTKGPFPIIRSQYFQPLNSARKKIHIDMRELEVESRFNDWFNFMTCQDSGFAYSENSTILKCQRKRL